MTQHSQNPKDETIVNPEETELEQSETKEAEPMFTMEDVNRGTFKAKVAAALKEHLQRKVAFTTSTINVRELLDDDK